MSSSPRDKSFEQACAEVGLDPRAEVKIGGNYVPLVQDGHTIYIAGQVPRVGDKVLFTGKLGNPLTVGQGQLAARICALRALTLLRQHLGSLSKLKAVLRLNVYVHCTPDFTEHSEVANGASDLLAQILGPAGAHTRTSVGVAQLPKNAAVEVDMIVSST